jgi:RimJ/RimL family protein N-acetyltransferase
MKQAPTLETKRLRLRHHTKDDFQNLVTMWSEPKVFQFIGGKAFSTQQTWGKLLGCIGHWALMDYGYWLVEEKVTGQFVGQIGFANQMRGISEIEDLPEMGWVLSSHCHGKGFATEGVEASLEWANSNISSPLSACIISPENLSSLKVAKKFSFKEVRTMTYQDSLTTVFLRDKNLIGQ